MAQQFDYPKTETQLREIQDALYQHSKEVYESGGRPAFKGLLEIMSAESTIITAIHNIKGNHGSETPGVDSKTMRKDYLQKPFPWVVADIQRAFKYFEPQQIRRVYIDKPGKSEKRPLGIPAIRDRIVQECMRIVLEPILEAQFFAHSYGFRPMRDAAMALERVDIIMHNTGNYWIVEGDISKCFDRIDHSILIKRLYHMGIKDRRVLQIIKAMLKAGVMEECAVNEEGTPQGGLISPLLANVYLDIMDEWVSKQWENKRTRHQYVQDQSRYAVMRKKTTLVPGYLVRYADDFIIATDTRAHAEDWKARLQSLLQEKMKLTLSQEKTLITDIRKKYIKFLGYEFKMVRGKSRRGYIPRTIPDRERLKRRADKIAEDIKKIPGNYSREQMVGAINRINSQIRGIIQYYQCCTWVNIAMQKHSRKLQLAARRRLKQYNGKWIPANQTRNLPRVHQQYKQKIPSIKYRDIYVGFTALTFCRWERTPPKNQAETPYTDTGRQLYFERTKKKKMQARLDEMYSDNMTKDDTVIITGDFGGVWFGDSRDDETLDWLERLPFTLVFVCGNHENYDALERYPVVEWHGGKVHRIRPHVLHLMRGQIFELEGCRFFTMGGAKSHDIEDGILEPDTSDFERRLTMLQRKPRARYRINHISWWAQELPSDEEYTEARRNLDAVGWAVDYIITHCAPTSIALMGSRHNEADRLSDFLQEVREMAKYHYWLFGHYHDNRAIDEKHILLWEQIVQVI